MTGDHANKGRSGNAYRSQDHGEKMGSVDMLLGAETHGEGSAGGNQSCARVPSQIPTTRQIAMGRTKMRSARKDCAFQSKTRLSLRTGACDVGDCVDIWLAGSFSTISGLRSLRENTKANKLEPGPFCDIRSICPGCRWL